MNRTHKKIVKVFFDTETYVNYKGISLPYLIGWTTDLEINKFSYSVEPHTDFFNTLEWLSVKYDVQLWAHNIQYDLGIIYPNYLAKLPHNSKKIWQVSENNQFIKFRYVGKGNNFIKFSAYCTYRWRKASLAVWADDLEIEGLDKGEIDYEKRGYCKIIGNKIHYLNPEGVETTSDLSIELDYLKKDVKILYKVWDRINTQKENILKLFSIKFDKFNPKTVPSFGSYLLNRIMGGTDSNNIYNKTYKTIVNKDIGKVMENTRMGGFTAYNRCISCIKNDIPLIWSYDINSMYPWIMIQGLPYGDLLEEREEDCMTWFLCEIQEIKWKPEYSFFSREPVSSNYKKGPVLLCQMYLNMLKEVTNSVISIKKEYYQKFKIRKDMNTLVDVLYSVKSDPNADPVTKEGAKYTMNTQYGKFMQRNYHKDYFYNLEGGFFEEFEPETERGYKNNLTGCYIVQVAQSVIIYNVIKEHENGNKFVYCDTDSIKMLQVNEPSFKVGEGLGEWKFEGKYNIYMNNGKAKKYFLWNYDYDLKKQQIKMSGIYNGVKGKILSKFSLEDYEILYNRANNVKVIKGTKTSCNGLFGQKIIGTSDVEFNKGKKITHVLDIDKKIYMKKNED